MTIEWLNIILGPDWWFIPGLTIIIANISMLKNRSSSLPFILLLVGWQLTLLLCVDHIVDSARTCSVRPHWLEFNTLDMYREEIIPSFLKSALLSLPMIFIWKPSDSSKIEMKSRLTILSLGLCLLDVLALSTYSLIMHN